jgi:probable phosphomutase (TIGR03848 family)
VPVALLVRHGLTAQTGPILSGWAPDVHLDDRGRQQAERLAERLAGLPLAAVVSSPLERCRETVAPLVAGREGLGVAIDDRLGECRYGDWTGRPLKELAKDPLWRVVQAHPSAVTFPGPAGEALRDTQARAVAAVRDWDHRIGSEAGPDALWMACSHGDVIKALVADALGLHLDLFQRVAVDPGALTAVRYTELRPFLLRLNDSGSEVDSLRPPKRRARRRRSSDAPVGGGVGGAEPGSA